MGIQIDWDSQAEMDSPVVADSLVVGDSLTVEGSLVHRIPDSDYSLAVPDILDQD